MVSLKGSNNSSSSFAYDYVFLGMGAANSLLVIKMFEAGLFMKKTVAFIEPRAFGNQEFHDDKTFCFWSTKEELQEMGVQNLVSKSWNKAGINGNVTDIYPYQYHHIGSEDLHVYTSEIIQAINAVEITDTVESVQWKIEPFQVHTLSGQTFQASVIFDSRPPVWKPKRTYETHLLQSFYGWMIKTPSPKFDEDVFEMMDFRVPQMGNTQFLYVLPYQKDTALIELTRFGSTPIGLEEAEEFLQTHIRSQYGDFEILRKEQGVIPMSTRKIPDHYLGRNALRTGSNSGRIKPSTGYAFKEMCWDAMQIAQNGYLGYYWGFHRLSAHQSGRFAFYDRLLLKILETQPYLGSRIFSRLFQKIPTQKVFTFLEEKTTVYAELPILWSLPKKPFIRAAISDSYQRLGYMVRNNMALISGILLWILYFLNATLLAYGLMGLGLVLVGIPHGALDHILVDGKLKSPLNVLFILKYLGLMALMFGIWMVHQPTALFLFLGYSAWHFGEGDFRELGVSSPMKSFFWGMYILATMIGTHLSEWNEFLHAFNGSTMPLYSGFIMDHIAEDAVLVLSLFVLMGAVVFEKFRPLWKVFAVLFMGIFLPLTWAFMLYFIGIHSLNGWKHLENGLQIPARKLWWASVPFSLGAYLMIAGFLYLGMGSVLELWKHFFIFLSCVSFPHIIEMSRFYRKSAVL
jgi:lycopene beta-cyclase